MKHEEAKKVADQALEDLAKELAAGRSQRLLDYLTVLGRFHRYSFGNVLLIAIQKSGATHVAGFHAWKKLDRHVKKGEKGIAILAPLVYKRKPKDEEPSEDDETNDSKVRGFKVVHVFDVTQTEGRPLPELASVSGDPGDQVAHLKELVAREGIELAYDELMLGALGRSEGGRILLQPGLSPAKEFAVLVHELAHEKLHKGERRKETTKVIRETEAEAVAYAVSKAIGLETNSAAADYIQLWSGDTETLAESLDHIQRVSAEILSQLVTDDVTKTEEVPHAA